MFRLLRLVGDPDTPVPAPFLEAFRRALLDPTVDPALRAEVLTLPSENYIAEQLAVVETAVAAQQVAARHTPSS